MRAAKAALYDDPGGAAADWSRLAAEWTSQGLAADWDARAFSKRPAAGERLPALAAPPSAAEFSKDWGTPNRPVVVLGCARQWRRTDWSIEALLRLHAQREFAVGAAQGAALPLSAYVDYVRSGSDGDDEPVYVEKAPVLLLLLLLLLRAAAAATAATPAPLPIYCYYHCYYHRY